MTMDPKLFAITMTIRKILLGNDLTGADREEIFANLGFCFRCGRDVMKTDGTADNCQCWNDD